MTARYLRRNRPYAANLQWVFGYLAMFFILVQGWDGTGYRRFFTRSVAEWQAGSDELWVRMAVKWCVSPVALTLYAMGIIMLPLMFRWMIQGMKEGWDQAGREEKRSPGAQRRMPGFVLRVVLIEVLGSVIIGHLLIRYSGQLLGSNGLGWIIGLIIWAALLYLLGFRPGGLFHRELGRLTRELSGE